ncbi:MAG: hypothetical protein IPM48_14705 [Saprospiraceae bacterium]|nr:hypothetical protein [Saprospiraceae bacterium]
MKKETRVFFVVSSSTTNEEIFDVMDDAISYLKKINEFSRGGSLKIALVNNAYKDGNGWNYEDKSDTFNFITTLIE